MNDSKKITWKQILHAIIQAAIAALTALGVTLILNLERTLFIRHQNGCLTKNCY